MAAFSTHMRDLVTSHARVAVVSLLDLQGKEKPLADAFLHHTIKLDSPDVAFVAFDFHEYWSVNWFHFRFLFIPYLFFGISVVE